MYLALGGLELPTKQKNLTNAVLVKIYERDRNVLTLLENRGFLSILRRTKAEYNGDIYLYSAQDIGRIKKI